MNIQHPLEQWTISKDQLWYGNFHVEMQSFGSWPFVLFVKTMWFFLFCRIIFNYFNQLLVTWSSSAMFAPNFSWTAENVMAGVSCGSEGRIELKVNLLQLWKGWAATGLSLDRTPRRQCCSPSDICDIWLEHSWLTLEILICLIKVLYVTNTLKLHKGHPRNWGKRKI